MYCGVVISSYVITVLLHDTSRVAQEHGSSSSSSSSSAATQALHCCTQIV